MTKVSPAPGAVMPGRSLVITFDFVAWIVSLILAGVLRFEFSITAVPFGAIALFAFAVAAVALVSGFATHLYQNRFVVGSLDELRALVTTIVMVVVLMGALVVLFGSAWGVPRSIVFIAAPLFLLFSGGLRAYLRLLRLRANGSTATGKRALIYGAGEAAEALIPQLLSFPDAPYIPVALVDDSPLKSNRWIRGVPMSGTWSAFASVVSKFRVEVVIVAIPSADSELLSRVYSDALALGVQVVVLPTLREYLGGRTTAGELRQVSIEDLIGRQPVELDSVAISQMIAGRRVLVTGAGGSIGSELVRQIVDFEPSSLTLVDRDETGLLLASMAIQKGPVGVRHETYLIDIRDKQAVDSMFKDHAPQVVFHAAALKHLPILESFPLEAWKTNVEGTLHLLEAAKAYKVEVFVNISTDKAANPMNVLGRSKRLGEELTAWFSSKTKRPYVSVRFGNVLGSRGSLIPILAQQIDSGGPVTITDKRATRYFMSIPEACQLVLQAAAQGEPRDVMVLDMGDPVSIQHIAERMIEMSGKQVDFEYVGLRPGEKLHEDLLSDSELPTPSPHPKIMRLKASPKSPAEVMAEKW